MTYSLSLSQDGKTLTLVASDGMSNSSVQLTTIDLSNYLTTSQINALIDKAAASQPCVLE